MSSAEMLGPPTHKADLAITAGWPPSVSGQGLLERGGAQLYQEGLSEEEVPF